MLGFAVLGFAVFAVVLGAGFYFIIKKIVHLREIEINRNEKENKQQNILPGENDDN